MRATRISTSERGAVAVVVAVVLLALGGFLALVLNVGHGLSVRGELQNASDAGALAGAWDLDGSGPGVAKAYLSALDYAQRHATDGSGLKAEDITVQIGEWDPDKRTFKEVVDAASASPAILQKINAVKVISARAGDDAMQVFLAGLLGDKQTADVGAQAVAMRPAPSKSPCSLPLAFAACQVLDDQGAVRCSPDERFLFHSDLADNIGFTGNTNDIRTTLEGIRDGTCNSQVSLDQQITVNNGSQLGATYKDFEALAGTGPYDAPVLEMPCDGDSARFNQSWPVIGFASVQILFAGHVGNCPPELLPADYDNTLPASTFVLILRLYCGQPSPAPGGGASLGSLSPPRLVQ